MSRKSNIMREVRSYGVGIEMVARERNLTAFLIEKPSKNLPVNIQADVLEEFFPVALSAFGQKESSEFREDVRKHLFEADGLVLVFSKNGDSSGKGVAFRTFSAVREDSIYLSGVAIDSQFQKIGLYRALIECVAKNFKFVVTRTQNPVVATALNRVFGSVAPVTRDPDDEEREVAKLLAQKLGMSDRFNPGNFVGKGIYGKSLYQISPKADPDITSKLNSMINMQDGDCIVLVCRAY